MALHVQYMLETWSTPEVRMFLPSYSFTIADRIFACRRSTFPQKASLRTSSIANDSGIALPQPQKLCMNAEPRLGALTAINTHKHPQPKFELTLRIHPHHYVVVLSSRISGT